MKKLFLFIVILFYSSLFVAADSITVLGGYVGPSGESDVYTQNERETTFEVSDLDGFGATFGYDHFIGEYVNLGGSLTFYQDDTDVIDEEFEFEDGRPIVRNISLQIIPLELNVRFLPAGRNVGVIPYLGGGAGIYFWEYEEIGDFVFDRNTNPRVVTGDAFSDGADPGWHVEGGVQIPFSSSATFTAEAKYWDAEGDLDPEGFDPRFEPIDLSAFMISGGVSIWF
jgi:hypothetical protein